MNYLQFYEDNLQSALQMYISERYTYSPTSKLGKIISCFLTIETTYRHAGLQPLDGTSLLSLERGTRLLACFDGHRPAFPSSEALPYKEYLANPYRRQLIIGVACIHKVIVWACLMTRAVRTNNRII